MRNLLLFSICSLLLLPSMAQTYQLTAPGGKLSVTIRTEGQLQYAINYDGRVLAEPSTLSMRVSEMGVLGGGSTVVAAEKNTVQRELQPLIRVKSRIVPEHYNELLVKFQENFAVRFRAYDEGFAYRFETARPEQITVLDERFELRLPTNDTVFLPEEERFYSHNERRYIKYAVSDIAPGTLASLPTLVSATSGPALWIGESDLRDYPGLWLRGTGGRGLEGDFPRYPLLERAQGDRDVRVAERTGYLAKTRGTRTFPWRILAVAEQDADLISNQLVYLLSTPANGDFSWVRPGKVAWDWWNANNVYNVTFEAGLNTQTYKHYIDFASQYGLEYIILDEGWSKTTDLLAVNPDIDLEELFAYARGKNVGIILWVLWNALDRQLEPALDQFRDWGAAGIKVDFMQRDDQKMVNYYWMVAEAAAQRKLLVDFHGSYKPAGLHRTYPNVITREGVMGLETSKWDETKSIGPEHNVTIPFIRMVAGPMDYTPGAMLNAQLKNWYPVFDRPMSLGTRCHQLAMYVVYESPLQMLADSPTHYRENMECMDFLGPVPSVWEETVPLAGRTGDYVAVARRDVLGNWYLGAMTDWSPRELTLHLDFLPDGTYEMTSFEDGPNAHRYASDYQKRQQRVSSGEKITLRLAPGGGWAARLSK